MTPRWLGSTPREKGGGADGSRRQPDVSTDGHTLAHLQPGQDTQEPRRDGGQREQRTANMTVRRTAQELSPGRTPLRRREGRQLALLPYGVVQ